MPIGAGAKNFSVSDPQASDPNYLFQFRADKCVTHTGTTVSVLTDTNLKLAQNSLPLKLTPDFGSTLGTLTTYGGYTVIQVTTTGLTASFLGTFPNLQFTIYSAGTTVPSFNSQTGTGTNGPSWSYEHVGGVGTGFFSTINGPIGGDAEDKMWSTTDPSSGGTVPFLFSSTVDLTQNYSPLAGAGCCARVRLNGTDQTIHGSFIKDNGSHSLAPSKTQVLTATGLLFEYFVVNAIHTTAQIMEFEGILAARWGL